MNHTRTEVLVGVFVFVGMISLGYLAIRLGKLQVWGERGYLVYADFSSVVGLKLGDSVEIAGVKIGKVVSIELADDQARLGLRINPQVALQEDVIASVRARGLIGDKFILISLGGSDRLIGNGGKIRETESPPDLPELLGKVIGGDFTSKRK
ncbi:MAG: MlaD family protein [Candidatus Binatia bacterium]